MQMRVELNSHLWLVCCRWCSLWCHSRRRLFPQSHVSGLQQLNWQEQEWLPQISLGN